MSFRSGGIISGSKYADPDGPYGTRAASGVWSLDQAAYWTNAGLWPSSSAPIGVRAGGTQGGNQAQIMHRLNLRKGTVSNLEGFASLTGIREAPSSCSSSVRGIYFGGKSSPTVVSLTIDYFTYATGGDAVNFGNGVGSSWLGAGLSSETRGVFARGMYNTTQEANIIEYLTIATTGDMLDFGDLSSARNGMTACASTTRGLFAGGTTYASGTGINIIEYVTIATTGNVTDFGDLVGSQMGTYMSAVSSSTRGVFAGGYLNGSGTESSVSNVIQYVTIATTGNTTDFGDLPFGSYTQAAFTDSVIGYFCSGISYTGPATGMVSVNSINYITIATTGDSTAGGDLVQWGASIYGSPRPGRWTQGTSNAHGGL